MDANSTQPREIQPSPSANPATATAALAPPADPRPPMLTHAHPQSMTGGHEQQPQPPMPAVAQHILASVGASTDHAAADDGGGAQVKPRTSGRVRSAPVDNTPAPPPPPRKRKKAAVSPKDETAPQQQQQPSVNMMAAVVIGQPVAAAASSSSSSAFVADSSLSAVGRLPPSKKTKRANMSSVPSSAAHSKGSNTPVDAINQSRLPSTSISRASSSRSISTQGGSGVGGVAGGIYSRSNHDLYFGAITDPLQPADYTSELLQYMVKRQARIRKVLAEYRVQENAQKVRIYQRMLVRIRAGRDHVLNEMTRRGRPDAVAPGGAGTNMMDGLSADGSLSNHQQDSTSQDQLADINTAPQTEEELEFRRRQVWAHICDSICRYHNSRVQSLNNVFTNARMLSRLCQRESSKRLLKCKRPVKEAASRAKRAYKEMLVFWKKNEKEERELRKRAEKEEVERRRREEEEREKRRQARKLNFLISQTELYSHFFAKKLGMETGDGPEIAVKTKRPVGMSAGPSAGGSIASTEEIDFDTAQDEELHALAHEQAANALAQQRARTQQFDDKAKVRMDTVTSPTKKRQAVDLDFQNPAAMPGAVEIKQPNMLTCELKPYQLRGLNWLGNLYEQGINGILADDMGLGKTVQSISLMAWLAETHNIWGPFLVISPASTLHNWQQEISRFTPQLKCLPYWGSVKDRKVLRKFWSSKKLSTRDAPFHILVTSYQIVVTDQQYFQRQRWQYMILDEAHAIKSSSTARWKILLNFNCRNRLLLTGTPVQNSMQELWALLHFIMPTFFDSHEEFSEWFSKDIESHATDKHQLNERQLKRLHMILKPFMLRRVKKDVEHELGEKIENTVYCELTAQQRRMYGALSERVSIDELLEKATMEGKDMEDNDHLMNAMIQFRKVCNHPQLFEVAEAQSPFVFCAEDLNVSMRDLTSFNVPYRCRNPITFTIPKFLYNQLINNSTDDHSHAIRRFSIWNAAHIHSSMSQSNGTFDFFDNASIADALDSIKHQEFERALINLRCLQQRERRQFLELEMESTADEPASYHAIRRLLDIVPPSPIACVSDISRKLICSPIDTCKRVWSRVLPAYLPKCTSPPIDFSCSDRNFAHRLRTDLFPLFERGIIYTLPQYFSYDQLSSFKAANNPVLLPVALRAAPYVPMWVPNPKQLLFQSGKLLELDRLLHELKQENHRVLIYFQMTKMIDLMEEYLAFRQYTYLRLDGSSKISDRRDMVSDWQTRSDIFIFLLSTRAGGLGINLTAADTVVFYDSDWNPTVDQQAMDRAHRLGQTRQVTVYRLITRGTIEERILQRAMEKDEVQKVVMAGGALSQTVVVGGEAETQSPSQQ